MVGMEFHLELFESHFRYFVMVEGEARQLIWRFPLFLIRFEQFFLKSLNFVSSMVGMVK